MELSNLFEGLNPKSSVEQLDLLVRSDDVRIERIVSTGQASPAGFWYDQAESEWVVLLSGSARLVFKDDCEKPVQLGPGDCVNILAHREHRVDWTSPTEPTVWLAVFYKSTRTDE